MSTSPKISNKNKEYPRKRLSIMVPAYNEEGNLEGAIEEIMAGANDNLDNFEIFIIDDHSKDKTPKIADSLAKKNKKIKVIHHLQNQGLGYSYREGLRLAKFEYYMYIPGDNEFPTKAFVAMLRKIGSADIIIPYVDNMHVRTFSRRMISNTFTFLMNLLFGLGVPYFNGTVIHKTQLLREIPSTTNGFAYQAEILVRMIKRGASYASIGYSMVGRQAGETSAFRLRNVRSVAELLLRLFWEVQIKSKVLNVVSNQQTITERKY